MQFTLFQKIGLSVLIFAWLVFGSNFLADQLFKIDGGTIEAAHQGSDSPEPAATEAEPIVETVETAVSEAPASNDLAALMASTDIDAGKKMFKKCKACHTIDKGGKNKVGPNLWGIVGRAQASVDGFKYSSAISQLSGTWTYEHLDTFLTSPGKYVAGNKMMFKGLGNADDRAALLLYLREQSDSPIALP